MRAACRGMLLFRVSPVVVSGIVMVSLTVLAFTLLSRNYFWSNSWGASAIPTPTSTASTASNDVLNPYPGKPRVTFNADGSFKITIFSDLHFGENPWDAWGPEQDVNSTRLMRTVLADEKPDYVVLNGDLITGENTFRDNSTLLIDEIMVPINEAGVKFSSTYGNHDNQANITHLEELQRELLVAPNTYTRASPAGVGGSAEAGPGSYWVPVYGKDDDSKPVLILWFFDSRGGFQPGSGTVPVPDWVDSTVADWISSEVASMEAAWGSLDDISAVGFVHIPPHTIQALQTDLDSNQDPGLNADVLGQGSTEATTDPADADSDDPFWTTLNAKVKNLRVVISGHDHGNEWCKREPTQNVIFCFDKHSGYGGYSGTDWGHGVRNLIFPASGLSDVESQQSQLDPTVSLETWIRLEAGDTRARVLLDASYQ